jgi:hypothetical protein
MEMTRKNAKKRQARALQAEHGGHYQHHLRAVGGAEGPMPLDEAFKVLAAMDVTSHGRFSEVEKRAVCSVGMAGWSADLPTDDPRFAALPEETREVIRKIVQVMTTKRVEH